MYIFAQCKYITIVLSKVQVYYTVNSAYNSWLLKTPTPASNTMYTYLKSLTVSTQCNQFVHHDITLQNVTPWPHLHD